MRFTNTREFVKAIIENNGVLYGHEEITATIVEIDFILYAHLNGLETPIKDLCDYEWFTTEQFKDKDLLECWDNDDTHKRTLRFWDNQNKNCFYYDGRRNGGTYHNYRKITPLPDWAIEAQKTLQD